MCRAGKKLLELVWSWMVQASRIPRIGLVVHVSNCYKAAWQSDRTYRFSLTPAAFSDPSSGLMASFFYKPSDIAKCTIEAAVGNRVDLVNDIASMLLADVLWELYTQIGIIAGGNDTHAQAAPIAETL